ncbi:hypothetical protein RhiirA4_419853 [Rhizophagus irregularis]|uniref:Crinkler family protein n=1 Tax=Rhizophagus irregularis TaxID=588596 RepID=A0A2I1GFS5_9GLOM|nr:hypothetical protein RhiirA4_419853 [Rhizophagus irregularis]
MRFFPDVLYSFNNNVKAKDLKLWKVDISFEEENEKLKLVNTKINVNIKEDLGDTKLVFSQQLNNHSPRGGAKDTSEDIRNLVIGEFLRMHKTSQHITSANEATRCEYISRIIYGVASIYGGEIKVYPQYEISGSHGKGPVDWAIKIGNIIITITEAKKEDINQGIAQNAIQLQTSIQHNPKKRSYDAAGLHEDVIYGIVSTAVDWIIIKLVSSNSE